MDKNWSRIFATKEMNQRMGRFAENYAVNEFLKNGFDVYRSEVDDHGVDFIAESKEHNFYYVQVKSVKNTNDTNIQKTNFIPEEHFLVFYIKLIDDNDLETYIIKGSEWETTGTAFFDRNYDKPGRTSLPEYGISGAKKYSEMLSEFRADKVFPTLK